MMQRSAANNLPRRFIMEYKYIQLPVLTKEQHEELAGMDDINKALASLRDFTGAKVNSFYTRWFYNGAVYNIKSVDSNSGPVEEAGEHGGFNSYGNPLATTPEPGTRTETIVIDGIDKDFMLQALAIAKSDGAAMGIIEGKFARE